MRQLAMVDAMFVLAEQPRRNTNHIGMVFVFDPASAGRPVTFDDFLDLPRPRAIPASPAGPRWATSAISTRTAICS